MDPEALGLHLDQELLGYLHFLAFQHHQVDLFVPCSLDFQLALAGHFVPVVLHFHLDLENQKVQRVPVNLEILYLQEPRLKLEIQENLPDRPVQHLLTDLWHLEGQDFQDFQKDPANPVSQSILAGQRFPPVLVIQAVLGFQWLPENQTDH